MQHIQELTIHLWKCYKFILEMVGATCVSICKGKGRRQIRVVKPTQSENESQGRIDLCSSLPHVLHFDFLWVV